MLFTQSKRSALAIGTAALLFVGFTTSKTSVAATPKPAPAPIAMAAQNDALDFDLVNKTGYHIKKVLISPSASDTWNDDDDVLGGQAFADGETMHISFAPHVHAEHWDMKVIYKIDGSSHTWTNLNLTSINKITLYYDADKDSTRADVE